MSGTEAAFHGRESYARAARADWDIQGEIRLLCDVLERSQCGQRVWDLGCGLGQHAIGMAKAGFEVVGVDVSSWALAQAGAEAHEQGVRVQWRQLDLLDLGQQWEGTTDAIVFVRSFGWGSKGSRRLLLRRLRSVLSVNGRLIVLDDDGSATLSRPRNGIAVSTERTVNCDDCTSLASLLVAGSEEPNTVPPTPEPLYGSSELVALVRSCGFAIEHVHKIGSRQRPLMLSVARRAAGPPEGLAVASWRSPSRPGFEMRYAPDEKEWLDPKPEEIWAKVLSRNGDGTPWNYPVDDPYGAGRGADVVTRYFGYPIGSHQLCFGAGVTSLLRSIAGLAFHGLVLAPALAHPDLESWSGFSGATVARVADQIERHALVEEIGSLRPSLVHLDRPNFTGQLMDCEDLYQICLAASTAGAIVVVDESAASCLGPSESAVGLTTTTSNLIVLRGFTKAYSCGGFRVAFTVASAEIAFLMREVVPPMEVSEPALAAALCLLDCGDIFVRFRARLSQNKPATTELLNSCGLSTLAGHVHVPWVTVSSEGDEASEFLDRAGIRGLLPAQPRPGEGDLIHLSIPLSDERMRTFTELLGRTEVQIGRQVS
jgi:histidinol-phosphate/aromatic aminotransferase/cobyric acid decarboxylase-like protein/SAM-dependent methyltransferase